MKAFAFRSNKKWISSIFSLKSIDWVAVTPLHLDFDGLPWPPWRCYPMDFASKWAQRINLQSPRSFLGNLSAFQYYREKIGGVTVTPPLGRTRVNYLVLNHHSFENTPNKEQPYHRGINPLILYHIDKTELDTSIILNREDEPGLPGLLLAYI